LTNPREPHDFLRIMFRKKHHSRSPGLRIGETNPSRRRSMRHTPKFPAHLSLICSFNSHSAAVPDGEAL
jgi:hypothetical protein